MWVHYLRHWVKAAGVRYSGGRPHRTGSMRLSRSFRRRILATGLASIAMVLLYQAAVIDSRGGRSLPGGPKKIVAGSRVDFVATAYCQGDTTASGVNVQTGIAAGDPMLLPEGSVVSLEGVPEHYRGIYTVMDTGPMIQGRHLDLYMWSCTEAQEFGRRDVVLTVLRLGWSPRNTAPGIR